MSGRPMRIKNTPNSLKVSPTHYVHATLLKGNRVNTLAQLKKAATAPLGPLRTGEGVLQKEESMKTKASGNAHVDGDGNDGQKPRKSQATQLIELASKSVKFFHSTDREPFAEIQCGDGHV